MKYRISFMWRESEEKQRLARSRRDLLHQIKVDIANRVSPPNPKSTKSHSKLRIQLKGMRRMISPGNTVTHGQLSATTRQHAAMALLKKQRQTTTNLFATLGFFSPIDRANCEKPIPQPVAEQVSMHTKNRSCATLRKSWVSSVKPLYPQLVACSPSLGVARRSYDSMSPQACCCTRVSSQTKFTMSDASPQIVSRNLPFIQCKQPGGTRGKSGSLVGERGGKGFARTEKKKERKSAGIMETFGKTSPKGKSRRRGVYE